MGIWRVYAAPWDATYLKTLSDGQQEYVTIKPHMTVRELITTLWGELSGQENDRHIIDDWVNAFESAGPNLIGVWRYWPHDGERSWCCTMHVDKGYRDTRPRDYPLESIAHASELLKRFDDKPHDYDG